MPAPYKVMSAPEQAALQDRVAALEQALRSVGYMALQGHQGPKEERCGVLHLIEEKCLKVLNGR